MKYPFEKVKERPQRQRALTPEAMALLGTVGTKEALRFPAISMEDHKKLRVRFQNACRRRNLMLHESRQGSASYFWAERRPEAS